MKESLYIHQQWEKSLHMLLVLDFAILLLIVFVRIFFGEGDFREGFRNREDVDGALVRGAGDPLGAPVEANRVNLCLVGTPSHLVHGCAVGSVEEPDQSALVTCRCEQGTGEVQGDER